METPRRFANSERTSSYGGAARRLNSVLYKRLIRAAMTLRVIGLYGSTFQTSTASSPVTVIGPSRLLGRLTRIVHFGTARTDTRPSFYASRLWRDIADIRFWVKKKKRSVSVRFYHSTAVIFLDAPRISNYYCRI